jgi:hypothetical protein
MTVYNKGYSKWEKVEGSPNGYKHVFSTGTCIPFVEEDIILIDNEINAMSTDELWGETENGLPQLYLITEDDSLLVQIALTPSVHPWACGKVTGTGETVLVRIGEKTIEVLEANNYQNCATSLLIKAKAGAFNKAIEAYSQQADKLELINTQVHYKK